MLHSLHGLSRRLFQAREAKSRLNRGSAQRREPESLSDMSSGTPSRHLLDRSALTSDAEPKESPSPAT